MSCKAAVLVDSRDASSSWLNLVRCGLNDPGQMSGPFLSSGIGAAGEKQDLMVAEDRGTMGESS